MQTSVFNSKAAGSALKGQGLVRDLVLIIEQRAIID